MASCEKFKDRNYPVYAIQGGGYARKVGDNTLIFIESPEDVSGLEVGDEVPEQFGIVAVNSAAERESSLLSSMRETETNRADPVGVKN